jgi:hypothetical protein
VARPPTQQDLRHDRAVRLLAARLEVVAGLTERSLSGPRSVETHVLGLEAATRHAVDLELVTRDEAGALWAEVAQRHPGVSWCRAGCPGLAA